MSDEQLIKAAMAVWPFGDGEFTPYAVGVENSVVWATKRGTVGLCGYALIPAELHPWSKAFPNGIRGSDEECETALANMRKMHELMEQGLTMEEAGPQVWGGDSIDRDYLDTYLDAHGGITYYQHPWVGFDCAHAWDIWPPEWDPMGIGTIFRQHPSPHTIEWNPDMVAEEAKRLARQIAELGELERAFEIEITNEVMG